MTKFGKLRIVASNDIGQLGSKEGPALIYEWKWYYSGLSLLLWLLLLFLIKVNRDARAWLIFIPLLIVNLFWSVLKKVLPFGSPSAAMFDQLFVSFTLGFAMLWLLGHKLGNRNRFVTFLLALLVMGIVGVLGAISYSGLAFSSYTIGYLVVFCVITFAMFLAFVLAALGCRKRYGKVRFVVLLGLWTPAILVGGLSIFYLILLSILESPVDTAEVLIQVTIMGLILSGFLYVILLPFMILSIRSSFYLQRLYAFLHLKSMSSAVETVKGGGPFIEQEMSSQFEKK